MRSEEEELNDVCVDDWSGLLSVCKDGSSKFPGLDWRQAIV